MITQVNVGWTHERRPWGSFYGEWATQKDALNHIIMKTDYYYSCGRKHYRKNGVAEEFILNGDFVCL